MPVRAFSQSSFFDASFVSPGCLKEGTLPFLLAGLGAVWFPKWLFEGWRGESRRGRAAWGAEVLATLFLLRWSETGMSRRAAVRRADTDAVWRASMGIPFGVKAPDEKTVRDFEKFLRARDPNSGEPRFLLLHGHVVRVCLENGVANNPKWAMDSTPMWCYGAKADTVRLLGDGLRGLADKWARATRTSIEGVATAWSMPFLLAKSTKGAFQVNWRDPLDRKGVLAEVVLKVLDAEAVRRDIQTARRAFRNWLLKRCRHLLRVIDSDLELDETGELAIAQKVAAGRLVSISDPEARHGRKTKSQRYKGYKVHLLGDLVSGLLMSVCVTPANVHDSKPALRLLGRAKELCGEISEVLADTAYGGVELRDLVARQEHVKLCAPPPPVPKLKNGKLGKLDFEIDFANGEATCPQGLKSVDVKREGVLIQEVRWSKEDCTECPLRGLCGPKANKGRVLKLHPQEKLLRETRENWKKKEVRTQYRDRTQCERLVNEVTRHGGRKAMAWGLSSAQLQAHAIATATNLSLLARILAARKDLLAEAA